MSLREEIQTAINKGFPADALDNYLGDDEIVQVQDEIIEHGRWYVYWEAVYRRGEQYVGVCYPVGATEMQDADDEDVEVYEVEPYEVTITKFRKK